MGRPREEIDKKNEIGQVIELYSKEQVVWKKERLLAIKLLVEGGKSYMDVASIIGRTESIVRVWTRAFRAGGIEQLLIRGNGGGRKGMLSAEVKEAMIEKLRQGSFRTAKQFKGWLRDEHGVEMSEKGVYYHLGKLGGRLKVARPSHLKKSQAKEQEFRETLAEKLEELNLPKDQQVSLWVYDEYEWSEDRQERSDVAQRVSEANQMRYRLHPLMRKMWSLIGTRVVAPVHRRFKWGYLFGAIEVSEGQIQDTPLPDNIRVLTLPAYSPELNPMEKYWDVIKDSICTRCWDNMEELETKIEEVIKQWWNKADGFGSLFTNSYLRSELNVT